MIRRHSRKRDAILACVRATDTHPSAEWVYARLKPHFPNLSLGTVYRNLSDFRREGLVASVGVVDGSERFDGCVEPHAHFICSRCGAVLDVAEVTPPEPGRVSCGVARECVLTLLGVCNQCVHTDA